MISGGIEVINSLNIRSEIQRGPLSYLIYLKTANLRDGLQIYLLALNEFKLINFYSPLKSSQTDRI